MELFLDFKCVTGKPSRWLSDIGISVIFVRRAEQTLETFPYNSIFSLDTVNQKQYRILGRCAEISSTIRDIQMQEWWSLIIYPFYTYNDPAEKKQMMDHCNLKLVGSPNSGCHAKYDIIQLLAFGIQLFME